MRTGGDIDSVLACCHGYSVNASEQGLGVVVTPVFSGSALRPDYLLVRITDNGSTRIAQVPAAAVEGVDPGSRTVLLGLRLEEI